MRGSAHNDPFVRDGERITTATNRSGGIQGGISNGAPVLFRVAFKPVATHFQPQQTVTRAGEPTTFTASGRHDPCVVPRAVPMVEAMAALTLLDAALLHRARSGR
jgi:chorismate synthase